VGLIVGEWTTVAREQDLVDDQPLAVRAGEQFIAIVRSGGRMFALEDECTHEECPLSDGIVTGTELTCYCHGAVFDLRTGEALVGPALRSVRTYRVRVDGGAVQVER
jgi:3-phenylpropionate/trans-cinnamate dioxygenase ferredoxin subunit